MSVRGSRSSRLHAGSGAARGQSADPKNFAPAGLANDRGGPIPRLLANTAIAALASASLERGGGRARSVIDPRTFNQSSALKSGGLPNPAPAILIGGGVRISFPSPALSERRHRSLARRLELWCAAALERQYLASLLWDLLANDYAATYLDASFVDAISARR